MYKNNNFWRDLPKVLSVIPPSDTSGYIGGVLKTSIFSDYSQLPDSYKECINKLSAKYHAYDSTVFCSLGSAHGLDWHRDDENIVITCIYGKTKYAMQGEDFDTMMPESGYEITLHEGQSLFIPKGVQHKGLSDPLPRVSLSMGTNKTCEEIEVDFNHYSLLKEHLCN